MKIVVASALAFHLSSGPIVGPYFLSGEVKPLISNQGSLGNCGGSANVACLNSNEKPLQDGGDSQDTGYIEKIPAIALFLLVGTGYIGGFFLALWGFKLRDEDRPLLGAGLFCLGFLGAVAGMGLLIAGAAGF